MEPGTPLTEALLVDNRSGSVPSFDIPAGMVAVSIPITRLTAVAYALQAGDHVNIIASLLLGDIDQSFQSTLPNKSAPVTMPGATAENGPVAGSITIGPATSDQGRTEIDPVLTNQSIWFHPKLKGHAWSAKLWCKMQSFFGLVILRLKAIPLARVGNLYNPLPPQLLVRMLLRQQFPSNQISSHWL